MQEKSAMMQQIESIPALMREIDGGLAESAEQFVSQLNGKRYKRVILTGCGDSLCAAMAAKFAFLQFTGLEVEVATVIDLSRYYEKKHLEGNGTCITVIVSNSGGVARIIELAKRVRSMGGFVVAVTGNESSGLAFNADAVVKLEIPSFVYSPGIRSYCGCLSALYHMAIFLGRYDATLDLRAADALCGELKELPDRIVPFFGEWEERAKSFGERVKDATSFELIGSGSQYASAWFGYGKALEATGKPSGAMNTEDWFHMNYFIRDVYHTATILFINEREGSLSRAEELIQTAIEMGRPLLCITDSELLKAGEKIITPKTTCGVFHALIQYLPVSMIFSYLGDILGETYFRDGKDNWTACVDCATIVNSREIVLE